MSLVHEACVLLEKPSETLYPEAKKTADVYQGARKRKSSAPQRSLSKAAAPNEIKPADRAAPFLWIALQEAQKKYQQQDFTGAIQIIDTILGKPNISALLQGILPRPDIQGMHFQLLKLKGLCLVEVEKEHRNLENPAAIDAAVAILRPLQENKTEDFEIQKALAYCFYRLSLCPSLSQLKSYHQMRAHVYYEKAHQLNPQDLSIVRDWIHLLLAKAQFKKALHILASIRATLATCNDKSILVPLLIDEAYCYCFLSQRNLYNPNDKPDKLCAYYLEKTQQNLEKLRTLIDSELSEDFNSKILQQFLQGQEILSPMFSSNLT
jgi:hypothetical protein